MTLGQSTKRAQHPRTLTAALLAGTLGVSLTFAQSSAVSTQGASEAAAQTELRWQLESFRADPANLKHERIEPYGGDEPLSADLGRAGLEQTLRRLQSRASLLMIVAHPDDEDGGMLTYESRGQGVRVGMLTLTRGEGGQNGVSGDFDDALGLVRTRELLAADRYLAVDQMFGTEADFGFSKTIAEAFSKWTHQRVLYDAVRAVRLYRPLVVASVFIGGITDGHGQHQVSGEIAQEVFHAAADPAAFPDMGLPPWQVLKVYARVPFAPIDQRGMYDYATGKYSPARFHNYITNTWTTSAPPATVTVPEGTNDPLLGKTYVQFAREGLALQRTQIGGGVRLAPAGRFDVGYTRYGAIARLHAAEREQTFFDGIDTSLMGLAELAPSAGDWLRPELLSLARNVARAQSQLSSAGAPEATAPVLREGLVTTRALIARVEESHVPEQQRYDLLHELRIKEVAFEHAIVLALGLNMRAEVTTDDARGRSSVPLSQRTPGLTSRVAVRQQELTVQVEISNGSNQRLQVKDETAALARGIAIPVDDAAVGSEDLLAPGATRVALLRPQIRNDAPLTRPYFTRPDSEQPFYDVLEPLLWNAPVTPPALTVWNTVSYDGVPVEVGAVVQVRPSSGKGTSSPQPLTIVPPVSVAVEPRAGVIPDGAQSFLLSVNTRSDEHGTAAGGTTSLELPPRWKAQPVQASFQARSGGAEPFLFNVLPASPGREQYSVTAVADSAGQVYREGYRFVGYPGIVRDALYEPASSKVRGVEMHLPPGLKVAYLPGTGDAVEATFSEIGIASTRVSVADIAQDRLAGYDALVLGVRAYAAHTDLATVSAKLLDYARAGGVVIVQYNLTGYGAAEAPYPLSLGPAEKVVEERAPVKLLDPSSQVLSWPNKITALDFDGWFEERGHGFMQSWDPRYAAVTEVHDEGQDPQRGGLLVAPVGKGAYVYCAFALYRQMPSGVPGAFRLMANLVSLGRHPR